MVTLNLTEREAETLYAHIQGIAPCTDERHPDHEEMESVRSKLFQAKERDAIRSLSTDS